jgi:hypothetical protein
LEEKGGDLQSEEQHPNCEARVWQHHVVGCFATGGPGALYKIDDIMREESYVDILKQNLETSVRKLNLVANGSSKWTMTTSILTKLWQNGLRTNKSRYWSGHHKALTSSI